MCRNCDLLTFVLSAWIFLDLKAGPYGHSHKLLTGTAAFYVSKNWHYFFTRKLHFRKLKHYVSVIVHSVNQINLIKIACCPAHQRGGGSRTSNTILARNNKGKAWKKTIDVILSMLTKWSTFEHKIINTIKAQESAHICLWSIFVDNGRRKFDPC